jgi:hypothetical protein
MLSASNVAVNGAERDFETARHLAAGHPAVRLKEEKGREKAVGFHNSIVAAELCRVLTYMTR